MTLKNIESVKCKTCDRMLNNGNLQCSACKKAMGLKKDILSKGGIENEDYIICPLCHEDVNYFRRMTKFHAQKHGFSSIDEFEENTGLLRQCEETKKKRDACNPWKGHGGKYSVFSEKSLKYSENRKKSAIEKMKSTHSIREVKEKNVFRIEYYIKKYGDNERARSEYSKAQARNKDYFVSIYGEELGDEVYRNKTKKWLKTMSNKPINEQAEINRRKIRNSYSSESKPENTLYSMLKEHFPCIKKQFSLPIISDKIDRVYFKVFDYQYGNKLIEFNGDYWHANPMFYEPESYHRTLKMKNEDVWGNDLSKINFAVASGYDVLIVWENDFIRSPQEVLNKCIQFLTQ